MVMYRDQFGEFVCAYWGLRELQRVFRDKTALFALLSFLERGSEDGADYVSGSRVPTELLS